MKNWTLDLKLQNMNALTHKNKTKSKRWTFYLNYWVTGIFVSPVKAKCQFCKIFKYQNLIQLKKTYDQIEHVGVTICKCRMKKVHHFEMWIQISATFRKPGWNIRKAKCSTTVDFPFHLQLVTTIWKCRIK